MSFLHTARHWRSEGRAVTVPENSETGGGTCSCFRVNQFPKRTVGHKVFRVKLLFGRVDRKSLAGQKNIAMGT